MAETQIMVIDYQPHPVNLSMNGVVADLVARGASPSVQVISWQIGKQKDDGKFPVTITYYDE